jgi:glutaminyl-peptide cyclotransferase
MIMMKISYIIYIVLFQLVSLNSMAADIPGHDDQYLMSLIKKYEKLGPKVPGTKEHKAAGDWIVQELKNSKMHIYEQVATVKNPKGQSISIRNIIGQFNPKATRRYLLSAHWDNRPVADEDTVDKDKPILGVNDGGSGVAVLLAIAKRISFFKEKNFGVDFIFFDAEDMGTGNDLKSYCLGSQYWASHVWPKEYLAELAINYDMVGGKDATFPIEGVSKALGQKAIYQVQKSAKEMKLEKYFPNREVKGSVLDDHVFVARLSYPVMDIIAMDENGKYPKEWHTHRDTSSVISLDTLNAVIDMTLNLFKNKIEDKKIEDAKQED